MSRTKQTVLPSPEQITETIPNLSTTILLGIQNEIYKEIQKRKAAASSELQLINESGKQ